MRSKTRRPMAEWQAAIVVAGMLIGAVVLMTWLMPLFLFGCMTLTSVVVPIGMAREALRQRRAVK